MYHKYRLVSFKITYIPPFPYPDKSQRKNMRIIHRDMTQNELRDIRKSNSNLADITSKLANGEIRKEDLDEDTVNRLKDVLYN